MFIYCVSYVIYGCKGVEGGRWKMEGGRWKVEGGRAGNQIALKWKKDASLTTRAQEKIKMIK